MADEDFVVTPWEVRGKVDYEKLVEKFGTQRITSDLLQRWEKHAPLHPMLRRGVFYSHRDFDWALEMYEKGNRFYLYTGRGPSGHTHIGHMMPWMFTRHMQEVFKVKLYFQLTDDEKFVFNDSLTREQVREYAYENALDLIALGFEPHNTKIFLDTEYIHTLYPIAIEVAKRVTFSTAKAVFGFENSNNIGEIFYTSMQAVPAFLGSVREGKNVPCVIPCAIDQDPHFRVARDVAEQAGYYKPAMFYCKMLPSLSGGDKMSSSAPGSAIYTVDTQKEARKKIMNAFTGGCATVQEQREKGANPEVCAVFAYFFNIFEEDGARLAELDQQCRTGKILCGECKGRLAERVLAFLKTHQERREKAKDRLDEYMLRD
ncbi:MAG: tryptophan--tRNA ligase [Euryarchaeota archaeon]|nr:tryptophan--tRNA ligase [Euryarchaeota archaeon]